MKRWMWFNFTHSLMNIVGSIDFHNSLQTFTIFFPEFSLTFSKKSLISLTFPDPLTNSLTFPYFPDQLRSRFLWAKCNLAKYNLRSRLNCHMRRMFCIALIVSYFDYAALATWYPICIEAHEKKLKNA